MTKKDWLLIFALVVLTTVYAVWFTDWFKPRIIQIASASRNTRWNPGLHKANDPAAALPPFFILGTPCRLTELKVVPLLEWQTNHEALPVWHLISSSNSVLVAKFPYGMNIRGMNPAVAGGRAQPLIPHVMYHLILKAGRAKGEHDFEAKPAD